MIGNEFLHYLKNKKINRFCFRNSVDDNSEMPTFYTLTFTFDFPHNDDEVYFAHSYPYTYTDLQEYLFSIVAHPIKGTYTTLRLLCKSLAGNNVYYVTVTTPPNESNPNKVKLISYSLINKNLKILLLYLIRKRKLL